VNVIALVEQAGLRPIVLAKLLNRRADMIDGIAGQMMRICLAADQPVAFRGPASASNAARRLERVGESRPTLAASDLPRRAA
jgi:hypothetical protein